MKKRKLFFSYKIFLGLIVSMLLAGGLLLLFRIDKIEVVGPRTDLKGIAYLNKKFIFLVNIDKAKDYIMSNNPDIKNVDIVKVYPRTLRLRIEKSNILAGIKSVDGIIYISEESRVASKVFNQKNNAAQLQYPLIKSSHQYFLNQFSIGSEVEQEEIRYTLFFLKQVEQELTYKVESVDIVNENMIVLHTDGLDLVFTVDRDKLMQFEELKFIIRKLGPRIDGIKKIDVRFEKPLLTYT